MGGHEPEGSPGRSHSQRRAGVRLCKDVLASRRGKTTPRTGRDCVFTWTRDTAIVAIGLARPVAHPAAARRYAVRSDHAGTRPAAPVHGCGPKSPDSHRVVWGLISRPPVSRLGFPPVSRLPTRALPLRAPSSGFPSPALSGSVPSAVAVGFGSPPVSLRVPFPLSNLHVSAAARGVPRSLVPRGRDQGHQFPARSLAPICRAGPPATQMFPGSGSGRAARRVGRRLPHRPEPGWPLSGLGKDAARQHTLISPMPPGPDTPGHSRTAGVCLPGFERADRPHLRR